LDWKIEFDEKALYDLEKLGKPVQKKIISYLKNRISNLEKYAQGNAEKTLLHQL
jgi:mRNA-degrading endonuclease RelE of RelBE toxin-antitoxin system